MRRNILIVLIFFSTSSMALSIDDNDERHAGLKSNVDIGETKTVDDVTGVVIDRTVTVIGHDFYFEFSALWRDSNSVKNMNATINEKPSARTGSLISIDINNKTMTTFFLPPARSNVKHLAEQTLKVVENKLKKEFIDRLVGNPDLGKGDM